MAVPIERIDDQIFPVGTIYFPFGIFRFDTPHDAETET